MTERHMQVAAELLEAAQKRAEAAEARAAQAEADRDTLLNSIYAACNGTGCLNAHELRQALDAAVRKREVLAAEVIAWREYERVMEETFPGDERRVVAMKAVRHAKARTNNVSDLGKESK